MCDKNGMWSGMCGQHHWMHIVIKILVALFIFWCGVQFGELKSAIRSGYYGMMSGYGGYGAYGERNQVYYGAPSMMGGWTYSTTGTAAVPTTTTNTTTKK